MAAVCGSRIQMACSGGLDNVHQLCPVMSLSLTAAWLDNQHSMSRHVHPCKVCANVLL